MALRGNLKDFSLPDVFQLVTFSRKTGVLRIEREDGAKGSVWFREGDVFFASSNWHTEPLGERLVKAQRVTRQALDRALDVRGKEGETGRRLGQILVDEGYITEKVLETFVTDQIQDTIFDLMRWDEGEFDFEAMPEVVEEDIGLSVSIENVVMEGSRRLEEWNRIRKKIPSMGVVFKMATAPGEGTFEISLKPTEWQLLLLIDGTRSVAELAKAIHHTDFEVARVIYGLFSAGLLEFATDEEVERLRAERVEREAKLAEITKARKAVEAEQQKAALDREAKLAAEAEARRKAAEKTAEAPAAAVEPAPAPMKRTEPEEVPEFIGGGPTAPTDEDEAVLAEIMGAVLERPSKPEAKPAEPKPAAEPYVPAEEPAFMGVSAPEGGLMGGPSIEDLLAGTGLDTTPIELEVEPEAPKVEILAEQPQEVVEQPEPFAAQPEAAFEQQLEAGAAFAPESVEETLSAPEPQVPDEFERDLMSLGLGELPSDLLEPMGATPEMPPVGAVAEPMSEAPAWVEESEEVSAAQAVTQEALEAAESEDLSALVAGLDLPTEVPTSVEPEMVAEEAPDFSALLESLDVDAEPAVATAAAVEPEAAGFDLDLLQEETPPSGGGVISTDAFLEDIAMGDMGYSSGLGDELSALTGAERKVSSRPQASVNAIPDAGEGVLHRDSRVDKDTLIKIIDGIKNL
jgi:hypothetical protein